jgi:hypothetical protein
MQSLLGVDEGRNVRKHLGRHLDLIKETERMNPLLVDNCLHFFPSFLQTLRIPFLHSPTVTQNHCMSPLKNESHDRGRQSSSCLANHQ